MKYLPLTQGNVGTPSITREQGEQAQKDGHRETMGESHFQCIASMFLTVIVVVTDNQQNEMDPSIIERN